ncbi:AVT4 [Candida margitis]|uniref:AVT4 n=1 Tax=Candida margitis TaxID=1775924 RepID=UPI00222671DC|nr:AVT4 [Candida margitis]KAI5968679.1 AVT4 [Candida margitis]
MTNPQDINKSQRRRSINLLTKSPLSASPFGPPTPTTGVRAASIFDSRRGSRGNNGSRGGSQSNSFVSNTPFLRDGYGITAAVEGGGEGFAVGAESVIQGQEEETAIVDSSGSSSPPLRPALPEVTNSENTKFHKQTSNQEPSVDFRDGMDDPRLISQLSKHLPPRDSLQLEGGDITRDLYKLHNEMQVKKPNLHKSKSFDDGYGSDNGSVKSRASSFNVPGGFRREFLVHQHNQQQQNESSVFHQVHKDHDNNYGFNEVQHNRTPNFLTKNFIEFLSIYGHFAGEDLEDDEDAIGYKSRQLDEETPLLSPPSTSTTTTTASAPTNDKNYNPKGTATDTKAYFLLLKAFVGTGVLFLPRAFANGGLAFSIATLTIFALLSFWCYLILVYAKLSTRVSGFAEIGYKLYGPWLQRLILSSIVISQVGFVAAYIVFTAENLRAFVNNVSSGRGGKEELDIVWFIAGQVVLIIPMSLIRDITKLSVSALLANLFILTGLITIIYYIGYEWVVLNCGQFGPSVEYVFNKSQFSLFIGTAIFAFEGIGLIIPVQESMIYPAHFPQVLAKVMVTIAIIFIIIGTLGYLTFGSQVQTVILLNLPQDSIMVIMTQFFYSVAILLSTPLQLFPAIRLIESRLFKISGKVSPTTKWLKNLFRCLFVLFIAYIALIGGANLDKFVSFIGCFACIPLVYMYPPMLHLKSCCCIGGKQQLSGKEVRRRYWLAILDYILIGIGGLALVYTTYQIIQT